MSNSNPGLIIFTVNITDIEGIKPYLANVAETLKPFDAEVIINGADSILLEGTAPAGKIVMLKFSSVECARAWYQSDAYQNIINFRLQSASGDCWLVEGA